MKKFLLAFSVLSLALVGCSKKDADTAVDKTKAAANTVVDKTKEVASDVKNAIDDKLTDWKLTPSDIGRDLEKGARVVRSRAAAAGEKVATAADNARIVAVINGKIVADPDLSAWTINVDADSGVVTLKGSANSPGLIGKAILLALETDGVTQVVSLLTVHP
jgi:osmotically-inducible protein OsmY